MSKKLSDLSVLERKSLAKQCGKSHRYLYQCAVGIRQPSPDLAKRIMRADPGFTWESIYGPVHEDPDWRP